MSDTRNIARSFFRRQALDYYLQEMDGDDILRASSPWAWTILVASGSLVLIFLFLCLFAKVDISARCPGILRPTIGVRTLSVEENCTVTQILAPAGKVVKAGDAVLRFGSLHSKSQLFNQHQRVGNVPNPQTQENFGIPQQKTILAPVDGTVEGLVAKLGDTIQAGTIVAKLVPKDASLIAISFLKEKDRAFVKEGDLVHIELTQYPYMEFGALEAQIIRIGSDLASPYELQDAFGGISTGAQGSPSFRVELAILIDQKGPLAKIKLRQGMLFNARFTLGRKRLISMVISPFRQGPT